MLTADDADRLLGREDATGLPTLVRQGEVSAAELRRAAIERIERVNGAVNAVVLRFGEADESPAQGPFHGVPLLLKDAQTAWKGEAMTQGSDMLAGNVAGHDAELSRRLRAAGFAVLGRCNAAEFGAMFETSPRRYGPCRNPWDLGHSTGGSSGGSAAAVAARMVPVAHAGDGAGSIRVPAAFCGVFGLKPSRGRIPMGPDLAESPGGTTTSGFVSLSVRDNAALLDLVAGPAVGDPYAAAPHPRFLAALEQRPAQLRLAVVRRPLSDLPLNPEVEAALDDAAALLRALGHEVVEDELPIDHAACLDLVWRHWETSISAAVYRLDRRTGRPGHVHRAGRFVQLLWERGRARSAIDYLADLAMLQGMARRTEEWMAERGHDAWLSPAAVAPPPPLGWLDAETADPVTVWQRQAGCFAFTPLVNHMGNPAMSVPLHWSRAGLPIGTHVCGRQGDESTLLRLARQLEEAHPWRDRLPPVRADRLVPPC